MVCSHLKKLYQLCESNQLRLSGSDLIRVVCKQCDQEEACPSVLMDEYDAGQDKKRNAEASDASSRTNA